jgi:hypothetical protein
MDMAEQNLILALVRDEPLMIADCRVSKPPGPNKAMAQVLARAKTIAAVTDEESQRAAAVVAQELQGLRTGLSANYKSAKQPVTSFGRALDNVYHELDGPLEREYRRIDRLVSAYQDELRRAADLVKAKAEAEQRERERKAREELALLQRKKEEAELRARLAESRKEREDAERMSKSLVQGIEQQRIAVEVESENVPISFEDPPTKPQGGRVWVQYVVEMVDEQAVALEHPELVKITLKQAAAQEFAKALDEAGKPMVCKGLIMRKLTRTSFTGAAAIRVDQE